MLGSPPLARRNTAAVVPQSVIHLRKTVVGVAARTLCAIHSGPVDRIVAAPASGDPEHARWGACVRLVEVVVCSSREGISKFPEIMVKVVRDARCDDNKRVQSMATLCFQNPYNLIVPALFGAMEGDDKVEKVQAANGIAGILSVRSREFLRWDWPTATSWATHWARLMAMRWERENATLGATSRAVHHAMCWELGTFRSDGLWMP